MIWRKSSYSSDQGDNCVEVAALPGGVAVRDSQDPDGPVLRFNAGEWRAFLTYVRSGN
jgi:uncharacterized protein DUF397